MATALEVLTDLVKESEGCKLEAYPDPGTGREPWTIGWGTTGNGITEGTRWTQYTADKVLDADCYRALQSAHAASPTLKDQSVYKQAAIADFVYNLGIGKYMKSTLKQRVDAGQWEAAKFELSRWVNGGGKVLPGLVKRRKKECELLDK